MVNVWDIEAHYPFLHIDFGKKPGNLSALKFFHHKNKVCPGKLVLSHRIPIINACRPCLKPAFENVFGGLAAILVLIADKEDFHYGMKERIRDLNFAICNMDGASESDNKGNKVNRGCNFGISG